MKKLGKYGKKGILRGNWNAMCSSDWRLWKHTKWSQDEKDVRNDISVYEEGADFGRNAYIWNLIY